MALTSRLVRLTVSPCSDYTWLLFLSWTTLLNRVLCWRAHLRAQQRKSVHDAVPRTCTKDCGLCNHSDSPDGCHLRASTHAMNRFPLTPIQHHTVPFFPCQTSKRLSVSILRQLQPNIAASRLSTHVHYLESNTIYYTNDWICLQIPRLLFMRQACLENNTNAQIDTAIAVVLCNRKVRHATSTAERKRKINQKRGSYSDGISTVRSRSSCDLDQQAVTTQSSQVA